MIFATALRCVYCDARYPLAPMHEGCPACATDDFRSGLTPDYDYEAVRASLSGGRLDEDGLGIWRYRRLLPVTDATHETSLGEGGTALVPLPRLAAELGAVALWVKDESRNPTWSFKDRHAAVTISKARDFGAAMIMASSSGNHGTAIAAYAARARLGCVVLSYPGISEAAAALVQAYGAGLAITSREGRWTVIREAVERCGWYPATNFTDIPTNGAYGHEGYKTIAYELHEQLGGETPTHVVVPTAYAEGLFGIWKGFDELVRIGLAESVPRMIACEPAGGPLAVAWEGGDHPIARVSAAPTVARGIGGSVNSYLGIAALRASNGLVAQASDAEILADQEVLARQGIFAEPAGAAGLAGLRSLIARGAIAAGGRIVVIGTSGGLKHLAPVVARYSVPDELDRPTLNALATALPMVREAMSSTNPSAAEGKPR